MKRVYLYGQVMASHSFLLYGGFPVPDQHKEIEKHFFVLGGETGTAAAVLENLGLYVQVAGTHIGKDNAEQIMSVYNGKNVDTSELYFNPDFGGAIDFVMIERETNTRTDMGLWGHYYSRDPETNPWYNQPTREGIEKADAVGLDPFFGDTIGAEYCREAGKKFATIDSRHDSRLHRLSEINAISHHFLDDNYPGKSVEELYQLFTSTSDGLTIFTFGGDDIIYGRKGQPMKKYKPHRIDVVSTLGAGDTFKAGTVYALANGFNDDDIVAFSSATAGAACESYPITLNPPKLEQIQKIMAAKE